MILNNIMNNTYSITGASGNIAKNIIYKLNEINSNLYLYSTREIVFELRFCFFDDVGWFSFSIGEFWEELS